MPYIGEGRIFYGAEAPSGWVFAGSYLSQSEFPDLYAVMGDRWGDADPGYFYAGNSDVFLRVCPSEENLGLYGGENEHTLTTLEMPAHKHKQRRSQSNYAYSESGTGAYGYTPIERDGNGTIIETEEVGGGQAFPTIPVYRYVNVIIFTGLIASPGIEESLAIIAANSAKEPIIELNGVRILSTTAVVDF